MLLLGHKEPGMSDQQPEFVRFTRAKISGLEGFASNNNA